MVFISHNFPALYGLLPRFDFFSVNGQFETFRSSYNRLPNAALANDAETLWNSFIGTPTSTISSFAINGSGHNTLRFLLQDTNLECLIPFNDSSGDGTVPTNSANALQGTTYFYVDQEHGALPNDVTVDAMIAGLLQSGAPASGLPFTTSPFSAGNNITGYTCSPVVMQILDTNGRMDGLDTTGNLKQEIPNSQFIRFSKNEGVLLSANDSFQVSITPIDNGVFWLTFNLFDSHDTLERSVRFTDIPISKNSRASLLLDRTVSGALGLDVNGDGTIDYLILPNQSPPPTSFVTVLSEIINSFKLPKKISVSLVATLNEALESLKEEDNSDAKHELHVFKKKVIAFTPELLSRSQAKTLLDLTTKMLVVLGSHEDD